MATDLTLALRIQAITEGLQNIEALIKDLDQLGAEARQVEASTRGLGSGIDANNAALNANNATLARASEGFSRTAAGATDMHTSVTQLGQGLVLLRSGLAALGITAVGAQFVSAADSTTRLQSGLLAVFESSAKVKAEFEFVRTIADKLGLSLDSVGQSYLSLAAAAKGTTLEGIQTRAIFESIATAMATLGKSSAETDQALRAVAQMMSKGTVSSEELRGQLGEALPGAFQAAARAMGVTTKELGKLLESGQITADEFLPKLAKELNKTFDTKPVETFGASLNRVLNSSNNLLSTVADTGIKSFATVLIDSFGKVVQAAEVIPIAIGGVGKAMGYLAGAVTTGQNALTAVGEAGKETGAKLSDLGDRLMGLSTGVKDVAAQTEAARTPLEKLQDAAARGDITALPEVFQKVIGALQKTGDAATAGKDTLAGFAAESANLNTQKVLEMATAIQIVGQYAAGAGDQFRQGIGAALDTLSSKQLLDLRTTAQAAMDSISQGNEQAKAAIIGLGTLLEGTTLAAFKKLGIDGQAALTGISAEMQDSLTALQQLTETVGITGTALQQAFTKTIDQAETRAELQAIEALLRKVGESGKLSAQEMTLALTAVKDKLVQIDNAIDPVALAFRQLGIQSHDELTRAADAAKRAFETIQSSGTATAGDLDAAFAAMAEKIVAAGRAAGPAGEAMAFAFLKAKAATLEQVAEIEKLEAAYQKVTDTAAESATRQVATNRQIVSSTAQAAEAIQELGGTQTRAIDGYTELTEKGREWAQNLLEQATATDNARAGSILYRDVTGQTIREIGKAIAAEKSAEESIGALQARFEAGGISARALGFELNRLAYQLSDPITSAGESAKQSIESLLQQIQELKSAANQNNSNTNNVDNRQQLPLSSSSGSSIRTQEQSVTVNIAGLIDLQPRTLDELARKLRPVFDQITRRAA